MIVFPMAFRHTDVQLVDTERPETIAPMLQNLGFIPSKKCGQLEMPMAIRLHAKANPERSTMSTGTVSYPDLETRHAFIAFSGACLPAARTIPWIDSAQAKDGRISESISDSMETLAPSSLTSAKA
jgi:hypothetical protein